ELEAALAEFKKKQLSVNQANWEKGLTAAEKRKLPARIQTVLAVPARKRTPKQQKELADYYATTDLQLEVLTGILEDHRKQEPKVSMAQTLVEGKKRKTHVLRGGDFLKPGARVEPGVPVVLGPFTPPAPLSHEGRGGRKTLLPSPRGG